MKIIKYIFIVVIFLFPFLKSSPTEGREGAAGRGNDITDSYDKLLKEGIKLLDSGEIDKVPALAEELSDDDRYYLLGLFHFYRGDYENAVVEIGKSRLDKNRLNLLHYLQKLKSLSDNFDEYVREHFIVRLSKSDSIMEAYLNDDILNKIYYAVGKVFDYYPKEKDKVLIEIYPGRKDFAFASTLGDETVDRSGAIGICKFNRVMTTSPRVLPYGYRWIDTICHEYVHFVINRITKHNCPLWLHEGIARYHETCWRTDLPIYPSPANVNKLIDALESDRLISFSRMHPSMVYLKNQDEVSLAFAEVCSAVSYISEVYPGKIDDLLREMAARTSDKSFRIVFGLNIKKFESKWNKYLKKTTLKKYPGVMDDKVRWSKPESEIDEFVGVGARDHLRLGDGLRRIGNNKGALYQYDKALKVEPFNPIVLLRSAKTLFFLKNYDESESRLKLCIEKNPNYVSAYELLGEQYLKRKKYDESIEVFNEAVSINPFNPYTHKNFGIACLNSGKNELAYRELNIARILGLYDTVLMRILAELEESMKKSSDR